MGALMFENSCTSMQMNKLDTISGTILGVFSFHYFYRYTNHCPSLQKQTLTSFIFLVRFRRSHFIYSKQQSSIFFMLLSFLSFFPFNILLFPLIYIFLLPFYDQIV